MRVPPHDAEAEQSVLGAMMLAPRVIPDVEAILSARDHYQPIHETIHATIVGLYARRQPVDMVTVANALGADLQRVGGAPYLHDLVSKVPTASSATYYAQLVVDKALQRRLIEAGTRIVQLAEETTEPQQAAQDAQQALAEAAQVTATTEGGTTLGDGLEAAIDWLSTPPITADTPWVDVNERTNGLLAGSMITVAARPGGGKSIALKDVAVFTAKQRKPVHIATLEMSRNEYMARILAAEAKVDLGKMLRRDMGDSEWERVASASQMVRDLPLYLDDRESQSMAQIRAAARQTQRRYDQPLGLIGIDYCQLVKPRDHRLPRQEQVAEISRACKLLAKEFHCPVMLLAQLNRKSADRQSNVPMVTDLRESGALEQDSDQVWLLHRPDQYGDEERYGEVDVIVGKNRNGPAPVVIPLAFQAHYARMVSLA